MRRVKRYEAGLVTTRRGRGGGTAVDYRPAAPGTTGAADRGLHRQADSRFHLAIASLSGSPLRIEAVTNVQKSLHDMLNAIPVLDGNMDHSRQQHTAIATAILAADAARARRVMESHCDDTAALLRGLL